MKRKLFWVANYIYFVFCFFIIMSCKARAYVDATSVTYVIQAVVGLFVAIGAVVTVQRHKIVAAYRKWYYGRLAKKNEEKAIKSMNSKTDAE